VTSWALIAAFIDQPAQRAHCVGRETSEVLE
jgi:hypothetical protein